jgi:hypothetical protein
MALFLHSSSLGGECIGKRRGAVFDLQHGGNGATVGRVNAA